MTQVLNKSLKVLSFQNNNYKEASTDQHLFTSTIINPFTENISLKNKHHTISGVLV